MMAGPSRFSPLWGLYISRWPPWGAFFRPRPLGVVRESQVHVNLQTFSQANPGLRSARLFGVCVESMSYGF